MGEFQLAVMPNPKVGAAEPSANFKVARAGPSRVLFQLVWTLPMGPAEYPAATTALAEFGSAKLNPIIPASATAAIHITTNTATIIFFIIQPFKKINKSNLSENIPLKSYIQLIQDYVIYVIFYPPKITHVLNAIIQK
jgi:hypothetical protein